jgi:hypothetical protein
MTLITSSSQVAVGVIELEEDFRLVVAQLVFVFVFGPVDGAPDSQHRDDHCHEQNR